MPTSYRVELCSTLNALPASEWNALLEPDDGPLLSWEYLEGLERTGCVGPGTSWQPLHLLVRRTSSATCREDELVAAAPCYLKYDSDGEWVFDMDWAAFASSQGMAYYPKLVLAVPFNPVSGSRLLRRPGLPAAERAELGSLLLAVARHVVQTAGLSSAHVLFHRPDAELAEQLIQASFLSRRQEQYHFHNKQYRSFEDFLVDLRGHRRTSIRRERRVLRESGVVVRTHRGLGGPQGFDRQQLDAVFDMYYATSVRYTGGAPYLNREFFHLCAERLGDRVELVLAYVEKDELVAGAWNLRGDTRLYGRYWGETRAIPFLHFEVCYYHSIERCISDGLAVFEPGHGGEHKLLRGFLPVYTYSSHYLSEAKLRRPIAAFLQHESALVEAELDAAGLRSPLRRLRDSAAWSGAAMLVRDVSMPATDSAPQPKAEADGDAPLGAEVAAELPRSVAKSKARRRKD